MCHEYIFQELDRNPVLQPKAGWLCVSVNDMVYAVGNSSPNKTRWDGVK